MPSIQKSRPAFKKSHFKIQNNFYEIKYKKYGYLYLFNATWGSVLLRTTKNTLHYHYKRYKLLESGIWQGKKNFKKCVPFNLANLFLGLCKVTDQVREDR